MPEPVEVMWLDPTVAEGGLEFEGKVSAWDTADESLNSFAQVALTPPVGCGWWVDIGYFQA